MKKHIVSITLLCLIGISFGFFGCASMDAETKGLFAGAVAEAFGADDSTSKIVSGVVTGTATFAEAKKAADALTPENEYYLGRAVAANITGTYKIYKNAALQSYVNKICNTLVINSPRPDIYKGYHVAILDTDEINAFATPGGHIFITRGLIACASSEDALASVIAHEIAHIQLQHALTAIRNARYANAAVSGVLAGISAASDSASIKELASIMEDSVNEIITTLVVKGFSKNQEFEADATALSLLTAAGYEPASILEMLKTLKDKQGNKTGFGKTHPSPDERITNVNKNLKKYTVTDTRSFRTKRYSAVSL